MGEFQEPKWIPLLEELMSQKKVMMENSTEKTISEYGEI